MVDLNLMNLITTLAIVLLLFKILLNHRFKIVIKLLLDKIDLPIFIIDHNKNILHFNNSLNLIIEKVESDYKNDIKNTIYEMTMATDQNLNILSINKVDYRILIKGIIGIRASFGVLLHQKEYSNKVIQSKMENLGFMTSGIVHDFNNIISNIGLASSLLKMDNKNLSEKSLEYLGNINTSVIRAEKLSKKLLAFSKKGVYNSKVKNIQPIIKDTLSMLVPSFRSNGIRVRFYYDDEDLYLVDTDPFYLEVMLQNLIINSKDALIEANRTDPISVKLDFSRLDSIVYDFFGNGTKGDYVSLTISDKGCGISDENLKRIFEPHFSSKGSKRGSGIGMTVVRSVIEQHNGRIFINSVEREGTTFRVLFPKRSPKELNNDKETVKIDKYLGEVKNCVIVTDSPKSVEILETFLTDNYFIKTTIVDKPLQTMTLLKNEKIDLIIGDTNLKTIGCEKFYEYLRVIDDTTKFVVITGLEESTMVRSLIKKGINGVITKPYNPLKLDELFKNENNQKTKS